ncbi:MAG: hypothetical protein IJW23_00040 [Lentisphaeria bacterium]|nr:hypothetical protein [Lentisphaeria bacterium]
MRKLISCLLVVFFGALCAAAPRITIGKTDKKPVIDGSIKAEEWKNAVEISGLSHFLGGKYLPSDFVFYAMYDDQNIYLAARSTCKGGQPFKKPAEKDFWMNDSLDIRLRTNLKDKGESVFLVATEAMGSVQFRKSTKLKDWKPSGIIVKGILRDSGEIVGGVKTFAKGIWEVEMAIPFRELGMKTPEDGKEIGISLMRNYSTNSRMKDMRWCSWNRHSPGKRFGGIEDSGRLVFGGKIPVYKLAPLMDDLTGGDVTLRGEIRNPSGKTAKVSAGMIVTIPSRKNKVALNKFVDNSLKNGQNIRIDNKGKVYLRRALDLHLTNRIVADGKVLYENTIVFTTLPAFHCEIIPLFLQNKMILSSNVKKLGGLSKDFKVTASIKAKADGKEIKGLTLVPYKEPKVLRCMTSLAMFKPGLHIATIMLHDKGKLIAVQTHEFNIPEKPEWLGNKLGISDKVPVPFTPVTSTKDSVSMWGRTYKFGKSLFPEQIISQDGAVISGPMELCAVTDKGKVVWKNPKLTRRYTKDTEAVFDFTATHPQLNLKGTVKVEYDGFTRIDFTLDPKSKVTLKHLSLKFNTTDKNAYYARALSTVDSMGLAAYLKKDGTGGVLKQNIWRFSGNGWKWEDVFIYYLWVGGDDSGVTLMVESDEGFNTDKYVQITPNGETCDVVWNFINKDTKITSARTYSMALQATPVKAMPKPEAYHFGYYFHLPEKSLSAIKGAYAGACYAKLAAGCAYPGLTPFGKKISPKLYKKYNFRVFADGAYSWVATDLPIHQVYGKELQNSSNFSMNYGGKNTVSYCRKGAFADYLCWIYKKRFEDGARGMYHDGVNLSFCDSEFHGCGYTREDGTRGKTNNVFAVHETFKRLYTMHKELAPDFFTFVHNAPITPIGGFADGCCEGESWTEDYSNMTTHQFRAGFAVYNRMSAPFNLYTFVSYSWRYVKTLKAVTKTWELIPICLSYNMYPASSGVGGGEDCIGFINLYPVWEIMDEWFTTSKLYRFWDKDNPVKVSTPGLKATVYLKKDQNRALVLITNIDRKKVNGTFTIDTVKLFGKKDGYEIREIFPAEYTFDVKKGMVILKKKSSAVLKEKPGTPVKASFDKRGVRYFEVVGTK